MASTEYTPNETRLLGILSESRQSTTQIVRRRYGRKPPRHARNSVVCVLNGLVKKTQLRRECYRICKSKRSGPHPIEFWIVIK